MTMRSGSAGVIPGHGTGTIVVPGIGRIAIVDRRTFEKAKRAAGWKFAAIADRMRQHARSKPS